MLYVSLRTRSIKPLNTLDWTLETFIRFLSSRHPGKESLVEIAGPLLFRIIIYYGSFPFHPKTQVRMSCEVFLRGTQLLSEQGQALLLRRSYEYEFREDLVSRHRLCSDDIRVFFRSMAIPRPRDASEIDIQERNEDDDRDLLDVMISIMKKKKTETESIWGYSRNELLAVAHTLPSSSSQATEGFIRHEEICALLDLLKTSKPTKAPVDIDRDPASVPFWRYVCECFDEEWGSWIVDRSSNDVSHHSLDDLLHTLQHPDMHSEPILWKPFCYLLQGIYVRSPYTGMQRGNILTLCPRFRSWNPYAIL